MYGQLIEEQLKGAYVMWNVNILMNIPRNATQLPSKHKVEMQRKEVLQ